MSLTCRITICDMAWFDVPKDLDTRFQGLALTKRYSLRSLILRDIFLLHHLGDVMCMSKRVFSPIQGALLGGRGCIT